MKRVLGTLTIIAALGLSAMAQDRSGYLVAGNRSEVQTTQSSGGALGNGHFVEEAGGGSMGTGHLSADEDGGGAMGNGHLAAALEWVGSIF